MVFTLLATAVSAGSASAASTGGVASPEPSTAPTSAPPKVHLFPVTSDSRSVAYAGPVYQKTATGEVVPYAAPTSASASTSTTTGTAASVTGGNVATSSTPGVVEGIPGELMTGDGMTSASGPVARPELLVPGTTARFVDGLAAAPMGAPTVVQEIIWAGNELIGLPYIYGGGHGSFVSPGYDCSGTVSFALHGADLLTTPADSSEFEHWGSHGAGRWVAIFSNPGHAYMTVAGLRLDTSPAEDPSNLEGPRWRPLRETNTGYVVRHPLGL
jgi:cell wall-associated NlpC family hydrolase